ncbi:MAG TPA: glycosyltransferase family A protein [Ilumatobacteraceae bacterium]|nr:glycosyltransferase family A protein [Ilumatobacteraceae bacterium]
MGRTGRAVRWAAQQVRSTGATARQHGWRAAIGERIAAAAAASPVHRQATTQRDQRIAAVEGRADHFQHHLHLVDSRFDDSDVRQHELAAALRNEIGEAHAGITEHIMRTAADTETIRENYGSHLRSLQRQVDDLHRDTDRLQRAASSLNHIVTDWLWAANAPLPDHPLISVVMATAFPERISYLRSAIDSVLAQSYPNWELIVIDDGDEPFLDPAPAWWPTDPRVRLLRGEGRSEGRARNAGIAAVTGAVVAYLDDDCRWFPWWLHAFARVFASEPDIGVVHGIRIIEADEINPTWSYAQELSALTLQTGNPADTNVMAHRAGLPDGGWPRIASCADYDTAIRLVGSGVRYIPVPAVAYATSSPSRTWAPERAEINAANFNLVQRRARLARPLRVVAHNSLYPLLSETYIGDELAALQQRDIDVVLSRVSPASVPTVSRIDAPQFESLEDAIAAHDPDVVLSHWAGVGLEMRKIAGRARVPYGIRLHGFDGGYPLHDLIDEWCVGLWDFAHRGGRHHLQFSLDTLIADPPPFSDAPRSGRVMSLSAGLPKKDFPRLIAAIGQLGDDVHLDIVTAVTNGFETMPAEVRGEAKAVGLRDRITVAENVDYHLAQAQLTAAGEELLREGRRLLCQMDAVANRVLALPLIVRAGRLVVADGAPLSTWRHRLAGGGHRQRADRSVQRRRAPRPVRARPRTAQPSPGDRRLGQLVHQRRRHMAASPPHRPRRGQSALVVGVIGPLVGRDHHRERAGRVSGAAGVDEAVAGMRNADHSAR